MPNETYTFVIRGLSGQGRLYALGLRPVYKTSEQGAKWDTIPGDFTWKTATDGFMIKFDHKFEWDANETVQFAFTYPFSYQDCIEKIDQIQEIYEMDDNIYFHRELLIYSLEKRKVELITITDKSEMTSEEEPTIKGWFPYNKKDK